MTVSTSVPVPTFSSPLAAALACFLAFKRAAGCRYDNEARALRLLDQFLTTTLNPDDPVITLDVVRRYVARRGEESETTRAHRLSLIRQVCRFLALEQPRTAVPGPAIPCRVRALGHEAVVPYSRHRTGHRPGTPVFHRTSDGRSAPAHPRRRRLVGAVLRVRDTKFGKSRLVPLASDVTARLDRCRTTIERHLDSRRPDAPFFSTASGRQYSHRALSIAFHQVLARAEIPRHSAGRSLRLHDLRHGFAVLRLLVWYQQKVDFGPQLPALATYLGHVGLANSQRYLQLTADMVGEIARRHERRFGYLINEGGQ